MVFKICTEKLVLVPSFFVWIPILHYENHVWAGELIKFILFPFVYVKYEGAW